MKQLKSLKFVLLVIALLLVLVIARNSNRDLFKADVKTVLESARNKKNTISIDELNKRNNNWVLVNLGRKNIPDSIHSENSIQLPFENLLDQQNRKILKEVNGDLILYSEDAAITAQTWVILNQLGFQDIYILETGEDPEVLKYKFQPDTTVRLEQDSI